MATNYKYTLKRNNGTDNDTLYPLTIWDQVLNKPSNIVFGSSVVGAYAPATGSILYYSSSADWRTLAAGTNGHVLTLSGGVPTWAAVSGGGGGLTNTGTGTNSLGVGDTSTATATASTAIGYSADATILGGTALGAYALASTGNYATAVGHTAEATGAESIAIGGSSSVTVAAQASGTRAIAIGYGTDSTAAGAVAIGESADSTASGAVQLGTGTNSTTNTLQFRSYQLLDASGRIPADRMVDRTEWTHVATMVQTEADAIGTLTISSTNLGQSWDFANFDYKLVVNGHADIERTDDFSIQIDSATSDAGSHAWVYNRVQITATSTGTVSGFAQSGSTATSISCGTSLQTTVSAGTGQRARDMEAIIHRTDDPISTYYAYTVTGWANSHWSATTTSVSTTVSGSSLSNFTGVRDAGPANPTDIVLTHNFHNQATDFRLTCRVYKRKKV